MFKNKFLDTSVKIFFHAYIRDNNLVCNQSECRDMVKERNLSDIDAINYWYNWDYDSVKRKKFIKNYFTELIKQSKEILENIE